MRISIFGALFCMLLSTCAQAKGLRVVDETADNEAIVARVYRLCDVKLGPLAMATIQRHVSDTIGMFSKREDRVAAALLVCVESRFNSGAVSAVGAVGLTQVMPKYAASFAKDCYLSTQPLDLWVPEVNLRTGFCQFRKLLTQYGGRYSMALAAYNAGAESPTVKRLRRHERINTETADYISRFHNLKEAFYEDENALALSSGIPTPSGPN